MKGIKLKLFRNNNWLLENGYSKEDEIRIYDELLLDVLRNTRWYLDNLESMPTFRVSWHYYKGNTPVIPYSVVLKRKGL